MTEFNKYGLSRYIPVDIRQEVRRKSKFGCVICRHGFYQYEHIDPEFENAEKHDPDCICCLCGTCHDLVTRGHLSKDAIKAAYRKIQETPIDNVDAPIGPLDFHDGKAELQIGGILYSPAVQTVLRYHGIDIIRVLPSNRDGEPGEIFAIFFDDSGNETLRIEANEWIGSLKNWDAEITGQRISIRKDKGNVVLQLRLDPPGRIIIERLDMRIRDSHILVTDQTYAVGRYIGYEDFIHWVHGNIAIYKSLSSGTVIEFTDPKELENRDIVFKDIGQSLATDDRSVVMNSTAGILVKSLGIAIAGFCGSFAIQELAIGGQRLVDMRQIILKHPDQLCRYISTGKIAA